MRVFTRFGFAVALALIAIALPGMTTQSSAAMSSMMPGIESAVDQQPLLEKVRKKGKKKWWRHRRRRHYRRHRPRFFFRFGGHRPYYYYDRYYYDRYSYDRYYYDDHYYRRSCGTYAEKKRCERKYRSFNWDTCRYTTYSGRKRLCPYVR